MAKATCDELELHTAYRITASNSQTQRGLKLLRSNLSACKKHRLPYGALLGPVVLEHSTYAWRRDYGEWPTVWNLADRYSQDRGISRGAARKAVVKAINDPSGRRQLHAISDQLLAYILSEDQPDWSSQEIQALSRFKNPRFFVSPDGIRQFECEDVYSQGIRYMERLTA